MKKRMKVLAGVLTAVMALGMFAGCGEKKEEEKSDGKYQVGLVAKNQTDQFTAWQANELVAACEGDYSDKVDVEVIDGAGDNAKLISGMETFISKGVDVIFVQPNDIESLIPTIRPVSYTHLDVYKRQSMVRLLRFILSLQDWIIPG